MTTENGMEPVVMARRNIETLQERLTYLTNKQDARAYQGWPPDHYVAVEIRAILWALPVLEAEFDALARLRRLVEELEEQESPALKRARSIEKNKRRADRRQEGAMR